MPEDLPVSREVIEPIPKECGSKGGKNHAQPLMSFPISEECGIEEEIDKQLLEIVIEAIEEFRDGCRRQRTVGISQCIEPGQAAAGNDAVPHDGNCQNKLEESKDEAFPPQVPNHWGSMDTHGQRLV